MAFINTCRILNLVYSDNRTYIDEIFNLNEKQSLTLLTNTGGKTTTCKFLLLPFFWGYKKYPRNCNKPDWSIDSYFEHFSGPTYIGLELRLDNNKLMNIIVGVKKDSVTDEINRYVFSDIYEEENPSIYDINTFPFYKDTVKKELKNPHELYIELKNKCKCFGSKEGRSFSCYCEYLEENNIDIDTIIKTQSKVISAEGGLATLFSGDEYNTYLKFFENYLIPILKGKGEDKSTEQLISSIDRLCDEENKAEEDFHKLSQLEPYIEGLKQLEPKTKDRDICIENQENYKNQLGFIKVKTGELITSLESEICTIESKIATLEKHQIDIEFKKASYELINEKNNLKEKNIQLKEKEIAITENKNQTNKNDYLLRCCAAADKANKIATLEVNINQTSELLNPLINKEKTLNRQIKDKGEKIYSCYNYKINGEKNIINDINSELQTINSKITTHKSEINKIKADIREKQQKLNNTIIEIESFNRIYNEESATLASYNIDKNSLFSESYVDRLKDSCNALEINIKSLNNKKIAFENENNIINKNIKNFNKKEQDLSKEFYHLESEKKNKEESLRKYTNDIVKINSFLSSLNFLDTIDSSKNVSYFVNKITHKEEDIEKKEEFLISENLELKSYSNNLKNNTLNKIDSNLFHILNKNNIAYIEGFKYLSQFSINNDVKQKLYQRIPYIIYSIVLERKNYEKLIKITNTNISEFCTPIFIQEDIEKDIKLNDSESIFINNSSFKYYCGIPENPYTDNFVQKEINNVDTKINTYINELKNLKALKVNITLLKNALNDFSNNYTPDFESKINDEIGNINSRIIKVKAEKNEIEKNILDAEEKIDFNLKNIKNIINDINLQEKILKSFQKVLSKVDSYIDNTIKQNKLYNEISTLNEKENFVYSLCKILEEKEQNLKGENIKHKNEINNWIYLQEEYIIYKNDISSSFDLPSLISDFKTLKNSSSNNINIKNLEDKLVYFRQEYDKLVKELEEFKDLNSIDYLSKNWDSFDKKKVEEENKQLLVQYGKLENKIENLKKTISETENRINKRINQIRKNFGKDALDEIDYIEFDVELEECRNKFSSLTNEKNIKEKELTNISVFRDNHDFFNGILKNPAVGYVIDLSNYREKYDEVKRLYKQNENKIDNITKDIKMIFNNFKKQSFTDEDILRCINTLETAENINNLTSNNISYTIEKAEQFINIIKNKEQMKLIDKIKAEIFATSKDMVMKILLKYAALQKEASKHTFYDKDIKRDIPLIRFKGTCEISESSLNEYLTNIIKTNKRYDSETRIKELNSKINYFSLINACTDMSKFNLEVKKKDVNNWVFRSYKDIIDKKISGAQILMSVFIIYQTINNFASLYNLNNKNATNFIISDNTFANMTDTEFVKAFYEIANSFKTQLWSWTGENSEGVISVHKCVFSLKCIKTEFREIIKVEQFCEHKCFNENEQMTLF